MQTNNRIDFEKYLKGEIDLPKDFGLDQYEVSKDSWACTQALNGRPFNKDEAERWVAFVKAIRSDFQTCAHIRDIFVLKNRHGCISQEWIDYLLHVHVDRGNFLFKHFGTIADRLQKYGGGIDEDTLRKILQV